MVPGILYVYVWLECFYDPQKATLDSLHTLRDSYPIDRRLSPKFQFSPFAVTLSICLCGMNLSYVDCIHKKGRLERGDVALRTVENEAYGDSIKGVHIWKGSCLSWFVVLRGLQRDVVYLGWPIPPSYISPNARGEGELRGLAANEYSCTQEPE